jgi:hypothetical protein
VVVKQKERILLFSVVTLGRNRGSAFQVLSVFSVLTRALGFVGEELGQESRDMVVKLSWPNYGLLDHYLRSGLSGPAGCREIIIA